MIIQSKRLIQSASSVSTQSYASAAYRAAGVALSPDYPTVILATSGLVAYWKLNETSGTSFADATGGGKTGTSSGSPALNQTGASIPGGPSVRFLRASSQYISFANIAIAKPFAMELWVNPSSVATDQYYFSKAGLNARIVHYTGSSHGIAGIMRQSGSGVVSNGFLPTVGTWYHVVLMQDANSRAWLYIDGFLVCFGACGEVNTDSQSLYIGGEATFYADAYISHVALYNRLLTELEIRQHAQRPVQNGISSQDPGYYLDKSFVIPTGGSFNYAY